MALQLVHYRFKVARKSLVVELRELLNIAVKYLDFKGQCLLVQFQATEYFQRLFKILDDLRVFLPANVFGSGQQQVLKVIWLELRLFGLAFLDKLEKTISEQSPELVCPFLEPFN